MIYADIADELLLKNNLVFGSDGIQEDASNGSILLKNDNVIFDLVDTYKGTRETISLKNYIERYNFFIGKYDKRKYLGTVNLVNWYTGDYIFTRLGEPSDIFHDIVLQNRKFGSDCERLPSYSGNYISRLGYDCYFMMYDKVCYKGKYLKDSDNSVVRLTRDSVEIGKMLGMSKDGRILIIYKSVKNNSYWMNDYLMKNENFYDIVLSVYKDGVLSDKYSFVGYKPSIFSCNDAIEKAKEILQG